MKKLILLTILIQFLFGASPQQVEQYIMVSNSEEELLELESQFSQMQNGFSQDANESYDMQLVSLRFKDYIERNLSEDEMTEVLEHYKNVLFLQYSSALVEEEYDQNESDTYISKLEKSEEFADRVELLDELSHILNNKEHIATFYDELLKPMMQGSVGGTKLDDEYFKESRDKYQEGAISDARKITMYATRDFSMEELEELLEFSKRSSVDMEVKVVLSATAFALKDFFLSLSSRYDVSKH